MKQRPGILGVLGLGVAALAAAIPGAAIADTNLGTAGGLTYIHDSAEAGAGESSSADAVCPAETHVLGGGTGVLGLNVYSSAMHANTSYPLDLADATSTPDDAWKSHFWNGSAGTVDPGPFAICKGGSPPVYRSELVTAEPNEAGIAKVDCPSGRHVTGGGVFMSGAVSQGLINSSHPFDDKDKGKAPDDGWRGRGFNSSGAGQSVTVHAICGKGQLEYDSLGGPSMPSGGIGPGCSNGSHVTGGGTRIGGDPGDGHLNETKPEDATFDEPGTAPDDIWWNSVIIEGDPKPVRSFAICKQ